MIKPEKIVLKKLYKDVTGDLTEAGIPRPLVAKPLRRRVLIFEEAMPPAARRVWGCQPRISNIMSKFKTNVSNLDLDDLTRLLRNVEYMPEKMVNITMRLRNPPVTCRIFRTGTISVLGPRSKRSSIIAARKVARKLQ